MNSKDNQLDKLIAEINKNKKKPNRKPGEVKMSEEWYRDVARQVKESQSQGFSPVSETCSCCHCEPAADVGYHQHSQCNSPECKLVFCSRCFQLLPLDEYKRKRCDHTKYNLIERTSFQCQHDFIFVPAKGLVCSICEHSESCINYPQLGSSVRDSDDDEDGI